MLQNVLELKTAMFPYHGLFMTLSGNLFTRLNRISLQLSRLTLVIQVSVVLPVDILKGAIEIRNCICLHVKIVGINLTMTALEP